MQSLKTIFYEDFSSLSSVISNEGLPEGSPVFRDGLILDGSSDYVTYNIPNTLLAKPKLSFVVEFYPDFDWDEDADRVIFSSTSQDYEVLKRNNAAGNIIRLFIGNTQIANISSGAYSSVWRQGERNVMVISGVSADTNVWLNGTQILTNDNTAWSPVFTASQLAIGAVIGGAFPFDGRIKSFSIHNRLLTASEAQAVYDNSLFNFQNKADVWLDMKSQSSDGTNQITKDKSGNGKDFKLGDGTTSSTFPTFSGPGFDFDGSTDYMLNDSASGIYNNTEQSIVIAFKPDFNWDANTYYYLFDSDVGARYTILKRINGDGNTLQFLLGNTSVENLASASYSPYWRNDGLNVIVVSASSGDTNVWLNKQKIIDGDTTAWTKGNPSEIVLGAANNYTSSFDGEIFHFSTYSFKLSPIQAEQLTAELLGEYH